MLYGDPTLVIDGAHSYRHSSWDRSGGNHDFLDIEPGQTVTLLDEDGPAKITHFYWTTINAPLCHFRQLVLRAWWEGEPSPSIEAPLGDFFCVPFCRPVPVYSLCAVVNPGRRERLSWGLNHYLPMPYGSHARLELTYDPIPDHPADPIRFWYHIEVERHASSLPADVGRLHAQWRREACTEIPKGSKPNAQLWDGTNLDGTENYVALEAEGRGQMVGLHLQVDNVGGGWYGEGDDMIFVDGKPGEQWPPTYHGTGSEEVFGGGACPNEAYTGPYTGFHLVENPDFAGKNAMYRWYLADPIRFSRSLVWTIEHGHANNYQNDYASVAYWYQLEPHGPFPPLPDVEARLPLLPKLVMEVDAARARAMEQLDLERLIAPGPKPEKLLRALATYSVGAKAVKEARWEDALAIFRSAA